MRDLALMLRRRRVRSGRAARCGQATLFAPGVLRGDGLAWLLPPRHAGSNTAHTTNWLSVGSELTAPVRDAPVELPAPAVRERSTAITRSGSGPG
jgi:hypothetical protein